MNNYDLNKFWLKFYEYCERHNADYYVRLWADESGSLYDNADITVFNFGSLSEGVSKFERLLDK